jgi:hypothetical protein
MYAVTSHEPEDRGWEGVGDKPPVTNTEMPARAAKSMVAETVVAPSTPLAITLAKSLLDVFLTFCPLQCSHQITKLTPCDPSCCPCSHVADNSLAAP